MAIRFDFTLTHKDGSKLTQVEKYELEKEINKAISNHWDDIVAEVVPSHIKCSGGSHKIVGYKKRVREVLR